MQKIAERRGKLYYVAGLTINQPDGGRGNMEKWEGLGKSEGEGENR